VNTWKPASSAALRLTLIYEDHVHVLELGGSELKGVAILVV